MNDNQQRIAKHHNRRGTFQLLSAYIYGDKALLSKATIFLLLATAADVFGPYLGKVFIDDYLMPRNFDTQALGILLGLYLVTQVAAAWLRYKQTMHFTTMALNAVQDIRQRAFKHVLNLPMAYFDHARTGQLVSRITNDTEAIKDLYVQFLSVVMSNLILLVGILIAMALLDLQLMLASALLIPTVVGVIFLYEKFSGPAVQHSRHLRSEINANVSESIAGMSVLQATNQQQRFIGKFDAVNDDYYRARMRTIKVSALLLRPAIDLLSVLVLVAIIWMFGLQVTTGVAEVGVLYAFLNYLGRFTEPLAEVTQRFNLYQQAMVAGDRVHTLIEENEQQYHNTPAQVSEGRLSVSHLNFAYQADKPVLHDISFSLQPGELYAIVGHTGSGKSTLLSLLLNFYQGNPDAIQLDGQPLESFSHDNLRRGIGLIPQEPFIVAGTLRDNIDMGRGLPEAELLRAAQQAHLSNTLMQLPEGLDTLLGEGGTRLSTGQRQQLVIARALAASPRILLLDEATANVDSETEQVIQRALKELHGQVTMIIVAHRLSTIKHAGQILVLSHGRIEERGTHSALMGKEAGLYRSMYQLQQQAKRVEMLS
ncbi:ABC transporter transmembrane domain-containing protein [Pontibacterium granulatum]|uniref:ABC transporter ATP-binding protein n=1 Tax=Pontibacterium granulatum TaxID=2036029 RepID=UPI00249C9F61|nr:ABC transporter transmembrane domain-containing protein [Pontibacterium granulatum]MDI3323162.1 ABC transporter transmembrane domain-containing protein [Pontibacterium granulatum]